MVRDLTTEEKIKEAARKIFLQKGYTGARTRDIAEEAGINLALLNYYFRSKEKLFELVMEESLREVFGTFKTIMCEEAKSLPDKIDSIVNNYMNALQKNPNLPMFVLGEIHANPEKFQMKLGISQSFLLNSHLYKQLEKQLTSVGMGQINPLHIVVNILSMSIFPFVGKPLIKNVVNMDESAFGQFIEERRKFIPIWVKSMIKYNI